MKKKVTALVFALVSFVFLFGCELETMEEGNQSSLIVEETTGVSSDKPEKSLVEEGNQSSLIVEETSDISSDKQEKILVNGPYQFIAPKNQVYRHYCHVVNNTDHAYGIYPYYFGYSKFKTANHYEYEGEAFKVYTQNVPGSTPLFMLSKYSTTNSFYTTSVSEMNNCLKNGYVGEGILGYVFTSQVSGSIPIYRAYKRSSGGFWGYLDEDHFYTASYLEATTASTYRFEGIAFYAVP